MTPSRRKKRARATPDSDEEEEEEVKKKPTGQEPSDAVLATWRRGDDDMEPSTKMLALVNYLKEWDASGDKAICYSQCEFTNQPRIVLGMCTDADDDRDLDAGPAGHRVGEGRRADSAVRR